ncbi:MAG TPA: 3-phosphoglycerate dehydrogenase family protein [Kofleriaceae bacterium]|nr:3-phosphoglycerate dehydrogenase family protein [Kofleriaceae bacterium]
MKILVADKFEQRGLDQLRELGCEVFSMPGTDASGLPAVLADRDPDALIVRSTRVNGEAIAAADRLKLIIRAGAGYDTIDVAAASAAGVFVANCPGKNAIAVAELAWALILSCDRRVPDQTRDLRAGRWNKKEYSAARGLHGATLGVLGLGTIGREVSARARAFGMNVIAWSRSLTEHTAAEVGVGYAATVLELARASDVVSVHVASTADTKHLIDAAFVEAMKPGAYLVNTSRGAVVDEQALLAGVRTKGLRAGLDVFEGEPGAAVADLDSEVAREPGVYGTHHVGASTDQAQLAIALEAARIVERFRDTGEVLHCVNRAARSTATCMLTVRHRNRPGVLAHVFQVLSEARINVEEMENILYEGGQAACARVQLSQPPTSEHLNTIRGRCDDILSMELSLIAAKGA